MQTLSGDHDQLSPYLADTYDEYMKKRCDSLNDVAEERYCLSH